MEMSTLKTRLCFIKNKLANSEGKEVHEIVIQPTFTNLPFWVLNFLGRDHNVGNFIVTTNK